MLNNSVQVYYKYKWQSIGEEWVIKLVALKSRWVVSLNLSLPQTGSSKS